MLCPGRPGDGGAAGRLAAGTPGAVDRDPPSPPPGTGGVPPIMGLGGGGDAIDCDPPIDGLMGAGALGSFAPGGGGGAGI